MIKTTAKILVIIVSFCCCTPEQKTAKIDAQAEKEKILELHNSQRTYHFDKMTAELVSQFSEHHISVNRGEINSSSKEEHMARFTSYFNSVEFEKWDDITPPVIRFSDDYSLAYTIVDKEVVVRYLDENGKEMRGSTKFSWVTIYKKYPDGWKIDCIASTNKPNVVSEIDE